MTIQELLNIQLKQDCFKELLILYDKDPINKRINKDKFSGLCEVKLDQKLPIKFMKQKTNNCKLKSRERCCSRIWDGHYGTRCKYHRIKDSDYCKIHIKMIKKYKKLIFNRYDEEKPMINDKGNRIPWFTECHIQMLDNIIQDQDNLLKRLINKNRKITPKI